MSIKIGTEYVVQITVNIHEKCNDICDMLINQGIPSDTNIRKDTDWERDVYIWTFTFVKKIPFLHLLIIARPILEQWAPQKDDNGSLIWSLDAFEITCTKYEPK